MRERLGGLNASIKRGCVLLSGALLGAAAFDAQNAIQFP